MKLNVLIKFCLIFHISSCVRSRITTERNVTATYGQTTTLPCDFDGEPVGVYWHRHEATGDLDSDTHIVVENVLGEKIIHDPRYDITDDYSMVIKNVTAADETTFSCEVVLEDGYDGKNYTDVRVISFGSPEVHDCAPTETPGACLYTFGNGDIQELTCEVTFVRPKVAISWSSNIGDAPIMGDVIEKPTKINGLINVSRIAKIQRSESIDNTFICMVEGEAVNGTSNVTVTVKEHELSAGEVAAIRVAAVVITIAVTAAEVYCVYRCYQKRRGRLNNPAEELALAKKSPEEEREDEINALVGKIQNYRPGSFGRQERRFPTSLLPDKIRLGLWGTPGAGKSSLIRTMYFACNGTDMDIEVACSTAEGGVTKEKKFYDITDSISIQDDRGMHEMDANYVPDIITNVVQADISCPIFVFNPCTKTTQLSHLTPIMSELSDGIRKLYESHPVLVLTHEDEVLEERDVKDEAAACTLLNSERIFLVRSLTIREKPDPNLPEHQEMRLQFLTLLERLLEIADNILIFKLNQSPPPYTSYEVIDKVDDGVDNKSTS